MLYSKDIHGQNILHYVAKSGNIKCLKLLLERGMTIHDKVNSTYLYNECVVLMYSYFVTGR